MILPLFWRRRMYIYKYGIIYMNIHFLFFIFPLVFFYSLLFSLKYFQVAKRVAANIRMLLKFTWFLCAERTGTLQCIVSPLKSIFSYQMKVNLAHTWVTFADSYKDEFQLFQLLQYSCFPYTCSLPAEIKSQRKNIDLLLQKSLFFFFLVLSVK